MRIHSYRNLLGLLLAGNLLAAAASAAAPRVAFQQSDAEGTLQVLVDGKEALVYRYDAELEVAHYYPVHSPSGKLLTIEYPAGKKEQPYPHHRSFWFADTVQLAGQSRVSFYGAFYSRADKQDPKSPFRDRVRNVGLTLGKCADNQGCAEMKLLWEQDRKTPVLDELRTMRVVALGEGQYFLDLNFTVTAAYGDVSFLSDKTHYAWPFVRIHPQFSVEKGGTLVNSEGKAGQKATNLEPARWIDYSNQVEGLTEGLAFFQHPDLQTSPRWLTRDYGTCGPRRPDDQSGKPFVLQKGGTLKQRVGVFVHTGDVKSGKVAEYYTRYIDGKL